MTEALPNHDHNFGAGAGPEATAPEPQLTPEAQAALERSRLVEKETAQAMARPVLEQLEPAAAAAYQSLHATDEKGDYIHRESYQVPADVDLSKIDIELPPPSHELVA